MLGEQNNGIKDPDDWDSYAGPGLQAAALLGRLDAVRLLVDNGARLNEGYWKKRPIFFAAAGGHEDVVEYLIGKGADANSWKIVEAAISNGHEELAKKLTSYVTDPAPYDDFEEMAYRALPNHPGFLGFLIEKGYKITPEALRFARKAPKACKELRRYYDADAPYKTGLSLGKAVRGLDGLTVFRLDGRATYEDFRQYIQSYELDPNHVFMDDNGRKGTLFTHLVQSEAQWNNVIVPLSKETDVDLNAEYEGVPFLTYHFQQLSIRYEGESAMQCSGRYARSRERIEKVLSLGIEHGTPLPLPDEAYHLLVVCLGEYQKGEGFVGKEAFRFVPGDHYYPGSPLNGSPLNRDDSLVPMLYRMAKQQNAQLLESNIAQFRDNPRVEELLISILTATHRGSQQALDNAIWKIKEEKYDDRARECLSKSLQDLESDR